MKSTDKFLGLNGTTNVSREEVNDIINLAKQENNSAVIYRLSKIINSYPDDNYFDFEILDYPATGLNGTQHTGDYKEALDDCGRLKKGFRFVDGKVVKVEVKPVGKFDEKKNSEIIVKEFKNRNNNSNKKVSFDLNKKAKNVRLVKPNDQELTKERVKKTASNYGTKRKREIKEKASDYPFSKNDIPFEVGKRAHYWTSFTPEKRAEQEQEYYFSALKNIYDKYFEEAKKQDKVQYFQELFKKYSQKYLQLKLDELKAKSRTASTMITGGSNFNVRKNEKAQNSHRNKYQALIDFEKKYIDIFDKIFFPQEQPIKTGKSGSLEKLEEKLISLQNSHEKMVKANAEIRKLVKKGLSVEDVIKEYKKYLLANDFTEENVKSIVSVSERNNSLTWLPFGTTNSKANINRVKKQIEIEKRLKSKAETTDNQKAVFENGYIIDDFTDNRVKIHFDTIPSAEIRAFIKKSGQAFKWSPFNKVWQRQLNTYYKLNRQDLYTFLGVKTEPTPPKKETEKKVVAKKPNDQETAKEIVFDEKKVERLLLINLKSDIAMYNHDKWLIDNNFKKSSIGLIPDKARKNEEYIKLKKIMDYEIQNSQKTAKYLKDDNKFSMMQRQANLKEYKKRLAVEIEKIKKSGDLPKVAVASPKDGDKKPLSENKTTNIIPNKEIEVKKEVKPTLPTVEPKPKFKIGDSVHQGNYGTESKILSFRLNRNKVYVYKCKYIAPINEVFEAKENELQLFVETKKPTPVKEKKESNNPKPFAIKPKSVSVQTAINDILGTEKYKNEKKLVATLVYNKFKSVNNLQEYEYVEIESDYENAIFEKAESKLIFSYFSNILEITQFGIEFINSVNNRLESLKNQKSNYAMFDNLAGVNKENNPAWFPQYKQFKNKPKQAIQHLMKVKKGDCISSLYREDVGYIDIVWGENDSKNKGFGLKHIVEKHGKEIAQFGMKIEDFIPMVVQHGKFKKSTQKQGRILLEGSMFRIVIRQNNSKTFILTAFDLREKRTGLKGVIDGINFEEKLRETNKITDGASFTKPPLYGATSISTNKATKTIPKNPRVSKIGQRSSEKSNFFKVNGEVGKFLQRVERKPVGSVVITIDGEQGAGKTTMLYQYMDAFASAGNQSLFISGEEHPQSELSIEKTDKYISATALNCLDVVADVKDIQDLYSLVKDYDVIFIDSWQKLQRMIGNIKLDEDLRQKFNGKVFVIIFQQTTTGRTKGGSEVVFDGDIIVKMEKSKETFSKNFAYFDKNRYTLIPIENIRYNIATGKTYNPNQKEVEPTEDLEFSFKIK